MKRNISAFFSAKTVELTAIMILVCCLAGLSSVVPAVAENGAIPGKEKEVDFSFSASPFYQFDTDLDDGGQFNVSRYFFRTGIAKDIDESFAIGFSFKYDYENYDFSGQTVFGSSDPWNETHSIGLRARLSYGISRQWSLSISPFGEYALESDANWGQAFRYGGMIAIVHSVNRRLRIGGGLAVSSGLEERKAFPLIFVYWKITDRLRLSNPRPGGAAGPAGLELTYKLAERWEIAAGGAFRTFRFRLDDNGVAPDGVGETKSFHVWGRITRRIGTHFNLGFYGGALLTGKLTVENEDGHEIRSDHHDPAPFLAVALSAKF